MRLIHRAGLLGAVGLLSGIVGGPGIAQHHVAPVAARVATPQGVATAADLSGSPTEIIAVNTQGTAKNESTDPSRVKYTFPLYSLTTGQQIGTGVDDASCVTTTPPPCAVVDDIATFHLAQGDIVSHALVAISPDSLRPGFILVGSRPSSDTIVKATGAFAGMTGKVRLSGGDDLRQFPGTLIQDDFWVIELR